MTTTKNHKCSCGTCFGLRVELAIHQRETGHQLQVDTVTVTAPAPVAVVVAAVEEAPVTVEAPKGRLGGKFARPLLAAALLFTLLGMNVVMEKTVQTCTALQTTLASQVVCP